MKTSVLCLLLLCACDPGTEINAGSYDQSCSSDLDCSLVFQGDVCASCQCPNTAINPAQLSRYQADLQSLRSRCGPVTTEACLCPPRRGLCTDSKCSARPE